MITELRKGELALALEKHGGSIIEVVLNEPFETWGIGQAMSLFAMLARELAAAEKERRARTD